MYHLLLNLLLMTKKKILHICQSNLIYHICQKNQIILEQTIMLLKKYIDLEEIMVYLTVTNNSMNIFTNKNSKMYGSQKKQKE